MKNNYKTLYSISMTSSKESMYPIINSGQLAIDCDYDNNPDFKKFANSSYSFHSYDCILEKEDSFIAVEFKSTVSSKGKSDRWISNLTKKIVKKTLVTSYNYEVVKGIKIKKFITVVKFIKGDEISPGKNIFDELRKEFIENNFLEDKDVITFEDFHDRHAIMISTDFTREYNVSQEITDYSRIRKEGVEMVLEEFKITNEFIEKFPAFLKRFDNDYFFKTINLINHIDFKTIEIKLIMLILTKIKNINSSIREYTERKFKWTTQEMQIGNIVGVLDFIKTINQ